MSGIRFGIILSVNRIRTEFRNDIGTVRAGTGTGFWVSLQKNNKMVPAFVTNRHNLDPEMLWPGKEFLLTKSEIEIRKFRTPESDEAPERPRPETTMCDISPNSWVLHQTADCAAVIDPEIKEVPDGFHPATDIYAESEIATNYWLDNNVPMMDFASFIGFPGNSKHPWWDEAWNLPIARLATLASLPQLPFKNSAIPTDNVGLVSGLSFSGSSGSPLLVHEKGIRLRQIFTMLRPELRGYQGPSILDHADAYYRPSKLIGIMSGHFKENSVESEMFRHSGLSYYTRSSAIREVLGLEPSGYSNEESPD